jgi:short-subunit dehydrogenase
MSNAGTTPRSILITGASSGIGAALALHYAAPGVALALSGRDAARLDEVVAAARARGAAAEGRAVDVTDRPAMAAWIADSDERAPLELVIANAGVSGGTARGSEKEEKVRRIFAVNVDGVLNTVLPAIPRLRARRRGQIALMSSLAAFRGFPGAPAYGASKAAVRVWGEALRADLAARGIGVSVICPGFVMSRMSATNKFRMPLLMSAEKAAGIIARGLARNRARISFPWPLAAAVWLVAALPPAWMDSRLAKLPRKD